MQFPLDLTGLSIWFAFTAIILLITSEIISPYYEKTAILIQRRRLRAIALVIGLMFIFTVFMRIFQTTIF